MLQWARLETVNEVGAAQHTELSALSVSPCVNTSGQTETGSQRCLLGIDESALSGSWHYRSRAGKGLDAMSSITIVNVGRFGMPSTSACTNVFAKVLMCV